MGEASARPIQGSVGVALPLGTTGHREAEKEEDLP